MWITPLIHVWAVQESRWGRRAGFAAVGLYMVPEMTGWPLYAGLHRGIGDTSPLMCDAVRFIRHYHLVQPLLPLILLHGGMPLRGSAIRQSKPCRDAYLAGRVSPLGWLSLTCRAYSRVLCMHVSASFLACATSGLLTDAPTHESLAKGHPLLAHCKPLYLISTERLLNVT